MTKVDFLKKRAGDFFTNGKDLFKKRVYSLAAFNLEQAIQLYLKYYLFKQLGDYPKIHSLEKLLRELEKVYPQQKKKIEEIRKEKASVIGDLDQAYITSRYLPIEFNRFQVESMLRFVEDMIKFLKKL